MRVPTKSIVGLANRNHKQACLRSNVATITYLDTTAALDTFYFYFIEACTSSSCSDSGNGNASLLSKPQDLAATSQGSTIAISWTANSLASSYIIYRSLTDSFTEDDILGNTSSANYLDTTFAADTPYFYFVEACNTTGCSEVSDSLEALQLRSPQNFRASNQNTDINLSWDSNSIASSYQVYRATRDEFAAASLLQDGITENEYIDDTLIPDTSYFYFVEACTSNQCSEPSVSRQATLLGSPANIQASIQAAQISLSWDSKPNATYYTISRAASNDFSTAIQLSGSATNTSFVDTTAQKDTSYFYFLEACNLDGCSRVSSGVKALMLSNPINLQATRQDRQLNLAWNANNNAVSYTISRAATDDFSVASLLSSFCHQQ